MSDSLVPSTPASVSSLSSTQSLDLQTKKKILVSLGSRLFVILFYQGVNMDHLGPDPDALEEKVKSRLLDHINESYADGSSSHCYALEELPEFFPRGEEYKGLSG